MVINKGKIVVRAAADSIIIGGMGRVRHEHRAIGTGIV